MLSLVRSITVLLGVLYLSVNAYGRDSCQDVLVNGTMSTSDARRSTFYQQVLAARYSKMTDEEISSQLKQKGSIGFAGFEASGSEDSKDFHRYLEDLRSQLDISTIEKNEASVLLSSGDKRIVDAWTDCMQNPGGFSIRFHARTPTDVSLILTWYAYPVAPGVSTDTFLKEDISIPNDIVVQSGHQCLEKKNPLRNGVSCEVILKFPSGSRSFLLAANTIHGAADAYLPVRQKLVPIEQEWKAGVGETDTAGVYAFENSGTGPTECVSVSAPWSFLMSTINFSNRYTSGRSDPNGCGSQQTVMTPRYVCFKAAMHVTAASDNKCFTTLHGKLIKWELQDSI